MMNSRIISTIYVLTLVLSPVEVTWSDATITMQDSTGKPQSIIEIKGDMARMSTPAQPDYLLYDASRDVIIHVNSDRQEYTEIDRATLNEFAETAAEMQQQLAPQMAQMREQLKSLPPEQRAMIEQQLGSLANMGATESKAAEPFELVKRGSRTVAGFRCQVYEVMQGKQRKSEVCVASAADAGVSKADYATLTAMTEFMREMASSAQRLSAGLGGSSTMALGGAKGVPVSVRDFESGREFAVASVSDKPLDDTRFSEYRTYQRQEMPGLQ